MLNVVMPSVIMLSVIMPSVIMLSVLMLSVIMLSVTMLSVLVPGHHHNQFIPSIVKRVSWFKSSLLLRIKSNTQTNYNSQLKLEKHF